MGRQIKFVHTHRYTKKEKSKNSFEDKNFYKYKNSEIKKYSFFLMD